MSATYQLHLSARSLSPATINPLMGALRFFYGVTLGNKALADQIVYARLDDSLPAVMSQDEVERFLQAVRSPKMRTLFATIYATGMRVSEVTRLAVEDIDSARMVIRINHGKGKKIALSCSPNNYWQSCAPIGNAHGQSIGFFLGLILIIQSLQERSNAIARKPSTLPVWTNG